MGRFRLGDGTARGYATVSGPGKTVEADTLNCRHCQSAIFLHLLPGHVGSRVPPQPGYCPHCHATICNACAVQGGCEPFEEKIRKSEERGAHDRQLAREMGITLPGRG